MKRRVFLEIAGEPIVGDLYLPAGQGPHPAMVVGGPMTSVKEQVTGVYAAALAVRGYAALAIDHRHYGESGAEPRQYERYDRKIEDLRGALAWLSEQSEIDSGRLGMVGVCLGCGYVSHAAVDNPLVRALGLVAGYYRHPSEMRARDPEGFDAKIAQGREAREAFEKDGVCAMVPAAALDGDAAMMLPDTFDYYATPRAGVPNYRNEFAVMSREYFVPFDVQVAAQSLTQPVAMVHADKALSSHWARRFFEMLPGAKSIDWLDSPCQVDFYDQPYLVNAATDLIVTNFDKVFADR